MDLNERQMVIVEKDLRCVFLHNFEKDGKKTRLSLSLPETLKMMYNEGFVMSDFTYKEDIKKLFFMRKVALTRCYKKLVVIYFNHNGVFLLNGPNDSTELDTSLEETIIKYYQSNHKLIETSYKESGNTYFFFESE